MRPETISGTWTSIACRMGTASFTLAAICALTACGGSSTPVSATTSAAPAAAAAPAPAASEPAPPPATAIPAPQAATKTAPPPAAPKPSAARPAAGTSFSGEGITGAPAQQLQEAVDQGGMTWRRDASAVAQWFVKQRFGWANVNVQFGSPYSVFITNNANGHKLSLHLAQPAKKSDGGVWVVESGMWA